MHEFSLLKSDSVRVGSSYHAKDGQIVSIKNFIRYEKYPPSPEDPLDYDFALLELSESLNFTDKIQSIALPEADTEIEDGTLCLVSGWGKAMNIFRLQKKIMYNHFFFLWKQEVHKISRKQQINCVLFTFLLQTMNFAENNTRRRIFRFK